jgi:hypothetical protein
VNQLGMSAADTRADVFFATTTHLSRAGTDGGFLCIALDTAPHMLHLLRAGLVKTVDHHALP